MLKSNQIESTYHCQITERGYTVDRYSHTLRYKFNQKISVNSISLIAFNYFNIWPNVNRNYSQFELLINGQIYRVTIPESEYNFWDIFNLISIFNTQINLQITGHGTWTFSLTGNSNKFVQLTNSTNTPFTFVLADQVQYNQLLSYLGFRHQSQAYSQAKSTQISEVSYNVQVSSSVHISVRNIGGINSEMAEVIASVPIGIINELVNYQTPFYECNRRILNKSPNNPYLVSEIVFSFLDDNGIQLVTENNKFCIILTFEKFANK